ncbi:helix-turn-helix transcriptional regulator [Pimelobacter simplex]|uniref:helix-turn-helix transcriptional regulator n=1 Tax=Nocardioides simplex TaxID=2045 RepID=UPI00366D14D7
MPEHLMGIAEIAERLGVSRTRVHQLRNEGALPEPYDSLAMGPVWLRADIEKWARETGRIK